LFIKKVDSRDMTEYVHKGIVPYRYLPLKAVSKTT